MRSCDLTSVCGPWGTSPSDFVRVVLAKPVLSLLGGQLGANMYTLFGTVSEYRLHWSSVFGALRYELQEKKAALPGLSLLHIWKESQQGPDPGYQTGRGRQATDIRCAPAAIQSVRMRTAGEWSDTITVDVLLAAVEGLSAGE